LKQDKEFFEKKSVFINRDTGEIVKHPAADEYVETRDITI
jgi:hypothetical protein